MTTFNYSSLSLFETCPRRFWLSQNLDATEADAPPSRALALGSWVHDAIEFAIDSPTFTFDLPAALAFPPIPAVLDWMEDESNTDTDVARLHADFTASVVRAEQAWREALGMIPDDARDDVECFIERAFYVAADHSPVAWGGREKDYASPPSSARFKSRLDVLFVSKAARWALLLDWKTGASPRIPGTPADPDQQLDFYKDMVFAHFPVDVVVATFANLRCLRQSWEPACIFTVAGGGFAWGEAVASEIEAASSLGESAHEAVENPFCPCEWAAHCPVGAKFMAKAQEAVELTAVLSQSRYRNDSGWGVWVFDVSESDAATRELVIVTGDIGEPVTGASYRITGHYELDPRFGKQIKARHIEIDTTSDQATQRILDGVKHVGPVRAKKLVEAYGADALDVFLDESRTHEVLSVAKGIGANRILESREQIRAALHETRVRQQLYAMLPGIHSGVAGKLWNQYREDAPAVLRDNPYLVLSVHGIGWNTADSLAQGMGVAPDSFERICAGLDEVFRAAENGEGHTLLPKGELLRRALLLLGVDKEAVIDVIKTRVDTGELVTHDADPTTGDRPTVQLAHQDEIEREILHHLERIRGAVIDTIPEDCDDDELLDRYERAVESLTEEQRSGVASILFHGCGALTGGAGTGKTHTLEALLACMPKNVLSRGVALAAPTGKAARVMAARTGQEAFTIHSLLKPEQGSGPDSGWFFEHNEDNPLKLGIVVIDETSMADNWLVLQLLRAVKSSTWVVFVGDANQLPPVGPGDFFRLLCRHAWFPVTWLTVPHRNAGSGAVACAAVLDGKLPDAGSLDDTDPHANHWILDVPASDQAAVAVDILNRWGRERGIDPHEAVVLSANSSHRGDCSAPALNVHLQNAINAAGALTPISDPRSCVPWRIGDRLVVRKNDRRNTGLVNGSLVWLDAVRVMCAADGCGHLNEPGNFDTCTHCDASLDNGAYLPIVHDEDGKQHELPGHMLGGDRGVHLAYALTTHQYQGSQSPLVVVCLDWKRQNRVVNRQHLYTSMSRFQKYLFVLVAGSRDLNETIAKPGDTRWTGLGLTRVAAEVASV